jgi:hypothetical protein
MAVAREQTSALLVAMKPGAEAGWTRENAHALLEAALNLAEIASDQEGEDGRLAQAAALTLARAVSGWMARENHVEQIGWSLPTGTRSPGARRYSERLEACAARPSTVFGGPARTSHRMLYDPTLLAMIRHSSLQQRLRVKHPRLEPSALAAHARIVAVAVTRVLAWERGGGSDLRLQSAN